MGVPLRGGFAPLSDERTRFRETIILNRRLPLSSLVVLVLPLTASAAPTGNGGAPPVVALAQATTAVAEPFGFPASPGGKVAAAFFRMMADGTDQAVRDFELTHRSATALEAVKIDERVKRMRELRENFGSLRPTRVIRDSSAQLAVAVTSARGGDLELEFNLDARDPGKIESIGVATFGPPIAPSDRAMSEEERSSLIEGVSRALLENYVFPNVAQKMAEKIRAAHRAGDYRTIAAEPAMASRLTEDLRSVSRDRHLGVRFEPERPGGGGMRLMPEGQDAARDNFAFRKVERLDGNVGYLRLDLFHDSEDAMKTADAALAFLRHVDALVIDLRRNGGGSPAMIRHITSYFFATRTHLNSMLDRAGNVVAEFWTGDVPGTKFRPDLPIYVLTSSYSFSGAEEFAYNLKNLKRATIVGETTGGGAHPVRPHRLNDRFVIGVPFQRAMNPITKTNWEGVGVEPDVKVSADAALDRALELARKSSARR